MPTGCRSVYLIGSQSVIPDPEGVGMAYLLVISNVVPKIWALTNSAMLLTVEILKITAFQAKSLVLAVWLLEKEGDLQLQTQKPRRKGRLAEISSVKHDPKSATPPTNALLPRRKPVQIGYDTVTWIVEIFSHWLRRITAIPSYPEASWQVLRRAKLAQQLGHRTDATPPMGRDSHALDEMAFLGNVPVLYHDNFLQCTRM